MKWPQSIVPFGQAVEDQTPGQLKVQRGDYLTEGALPVIDQGQKPIAGYTNELDYAYHGPLPVVLFGDHTLVFKHVDFPFALGADGVRVLSAKPPFLSKFLFYYLTSVRIPSRGYSRHFKFLREIKFPHTPISEQRRIVDLLEQADGLRRQRAEADALADRITPALFHKMFGDPAANPKKWPISHGARIFSQVRYGVGTPPPFAPSGVPFLRAGNIDHGQVVAKNLVFFSPEFESSMDRSRVSAGDVVVVRRGAYTGDCAVVPPQFDGSYVGYDLICVPARTTNPDWFCSAFLYPTIWQQIDNIRNRAAQQGLNREQILSFSMPYPPKGVQDSFAALVQRLREHRGHSETARANLETLFEVMLHRAFTGELTAKWREAHLKELLVEMEQQARLLNQSAPRN